MHSSLYCICIHRTVQSGYTVKTEESTQHILCNKCCLARSQCHILTKDEFLTGKYSGKSCCWLFSCLNTNIWVVFLLFSCTVRLEPWLRPDFWFHELLHIPFRMFLGLKPQCLEYFDLWTLIFNQFRFFCPQNLNRLKTSHSGSGLRSRFFTKDI